MENRYVNRAKITESKFRELVKLFTLDLTATEVAKMSDLNRNTVNRYINEIRRRLAEYCEITSPVAQGSCCSAKVPKNNLRYLGILEKDATICVRPLPNIKEDALNTASCPIDTTPDLIVDLKEDRRVWRKSRRQLRAEHRSKLNYIDGFLSFSNKRMEKFKGIHNQTYFLHIKESEFRYNNEEDKLYQLILKIVRNKPLF